MEKWYILSFCYHFYSYGKWLKSFPRKCFVWMQRSTDSRIRRKYQNEFLLLFSLPIFDTECNTDFTFLTLTLSFSKTVIRDLNFRERGEMWRDGGVCGWMKGEKTKKEGRRWFCLNKKERRKGKRKLTYSRDLIFPRIEEEKWNYLLLPLLSLGIRLLIPAHDLMPCVFTKEEWIRRKEVDFHSKRRK